MQIRDKYLKKKSYMRNAANLKQFPMIKIINANNTWQYFYTFAAQILKTRFQRQPLIFEFKFHVSKQSIHGGPFFQTGLIKQGMKLSGLHENNWIIEKNIKVFNKKLNEMIYHQISLWLRNQSPDKWLNWKRTALTGIGFKNFLLNWPYMRCNMKLK